MSKLNKVKVAEFSRSGVNENPPGAARSQFPYRLGVELELENVQEVKNISGWDLHHDDSLRNGVEYVFSRGKAGSHALSAVDNFYSAGLVWNNTPRASTHIHVNVSDTTLGVVRNMFLISYFLEDALFQSLSADRKYCGYCMPLSEMPPDRVRILLNESGFRTFLERGIGGHNVNKYYGLNVNSIRKHGTVELRYFPGGPDKEELLAWMDYATLLRKAAETDAMEKLSSFDWPHELHAWVLENFPVWGEKLLRIRDEQFMFSALQEVLAMIPEEEEDLRRDPLVFGKESLVQVVARAYGFSEKQKDHLMKSSKNLEVMSARDWERMVARSQLAEQENEQEDPRVKEMDDFYARALHNLRRAQENRVVLLQEQDENPEW